MRSRTSGACAGLRRYLRCRCVLVSRCSSASPDTRTDKPAVAAYPRRRHERPPQRSWPPAVGLSVPNMTLACPSGDPSVRLRSTGSVRPMLACVWATWCGPCVREARSLVGLARAGARRVDVSGVLTEDTQDAGLGFARQFRRTARRLSTTVGVVLRASLARTAPNPVLRRTRHNHLPAARQDQERACSAVPHARPSWGDVAPSGLSESWVSWPDPISR